MLLKLPAWICLHFVESARSFSVSPYDYGIYKLGFWADLNKYNKTIERIDGLVVSTPVDLRRPTKRIRGAKMTRSLIRWT